MKKFLLGLLLLTMSFSLFGETYTGNGKGYLGELEVSVEIADDTLKNITVTDHVDTPALAEAAFKNISKKMIESQSTDIDSMAGATFSSEGFISAVKEVVDKSGAKLTKREVSNTAIKMTSIATDIVIIGGGGAGLTAAVEAREKGANVILVEKMPILGGNTLYATGGMNAAGTDYQSMKDSVELHFNDTMKGGHNKNNVSLVRTMVENGASMVEWLTDRGADLTEVGRAGGASVDRIHRPDGGNKIGPDLIAALSKKAEEIGVDIRTSTEAIEIVTTKHGRIRGIVAKTDGETYSIRTKAVVLATGGFGANSEMFARLKPSLEGFGSTNHPGATGDAFDLVTKFDVEMVDMKEIQAHPTAVGNTMITEGVRGAGAILLNTDSKRFIDELSTRDVVANAILQQDEKSAFLVFDQGVREYLGAIEGYYNMGLLTEADTLDGLATNLGLNPDDFKIAIKKYNEIATAQKDMDFGRTSMKAIFTKPPYYAAKVNPAVHHTMGGVKIDSKAQVYNDTGSVVNGLFAAGEVTGGIHGGNRLGGNAITDITVFGRIAGDSAAKFIK